MSCTEIFGAKLGKFSGHKGKKATKKILTAKTTAEFFVKIEFE
jgi:hypothetical protein